jgi:hypothetical protein
LVVGASGHLRRTGVGLPIVTRWEVYLLPVQIRDLPGRAIVILLDQTWSVEITFLYPTRVTQWEMTPAAKIFNSLSAPSVSQYRFHLVLLVLRLRFALDHLFGFELRI